MMCRRGLRSVQPCHHLLRGTSCAKLLTVACQYSRRVSHASALYDRVSYSLYLLCEVSVKKMAASDQFISIQVEFGGGAELLFEKVKEHKVKLPVDDICWTIRRLLVWIKDNLLKERPELFVQEDTVRPGILVLVNDSDWELVGELEYEIKNGDRIVFISTLHGG